MTTDLNVRDKKVQVTVQVHQIVRRRKSLREVMAIEVHLNNVWKGTVTQEFENLMVPSLRKRVLTIKLDFSCRRELKPAEDITPEERDARTAFCMQLARNIRPRDLEEFFSKVGQVSHLVIFASLDLSSCIPLFSISATESWNNVTFRLLMCELSLIATQDAPKGLLMLNSQIDQLCLW